MRTCTECGEAKDERDFYFDKRRGYQKRCKRCVIGSARRWQAKNPERAREIAHKWYAENPRRRQGYCLKRSFGLTVEQYETLLSAQNGVCAICGKPPNGKRLAVDHSHSTNNIRGLLCTNCNIYLGMWEAWPEFPDRARAYLEGLPQPGSAKQHRKRERPMTLSEQLRAMRESK